MKLLVALFIVCTTTPIHGQLVHIGPVDKDYCENVERLEPNLVLSGPTNLSGRILDQTGAPFQNSIVEVRIFASSKRQPPLRKVATDDKGFFSFGMLEKGSYRLLASPTRAFKQTGRQYCDDGAKCELNITLEVNPTDTLDSECPIR